MREKTGPLILQATALTARPLINVNYAILVFSFASTVAPNCYQPLFSCLMTEILLVGLGYCSGQLSTCTYYISDIQDVIKDDVSVSATIKRIYFQ